MPARQTKCMTGTAIANMRDMDGVVDYGNDGNDGDDGDAGVAKVVKNQTPNKTTMTLVLMKCTAVCWGTGTANGD